MNKDIYKRKQRTILKKGKGIMGSPYYHYTEKCYERF